MGTFGLKQGRGNWDKGREAKKLGGRGKQQ